MKNLNFGSSKQLKRIAVFIPLLSAILVSGCQTAQVKSSNVNFPPTVLTFKYSKDQTTVNQVLNTLSASLDRALRYIPNKQQRSVVNSGTPSIKGKTIDKKCENSNKCIFEVTIVNGGVYPPGVGVRATTQKFEVPVNIIENKDIILAKVSINGLVDTLEGRNLIYIPYSPYLSNSKLVNIFRAISRISPVIKKSRSFNGDFDLDAKDDVVYGNFKRLMGIHSSEKGKDVIGKKSIFNLKTPNKTIPLFIEVYPSRKGSLTNYEFTIDYQLKPDGTSTFDSKLPNTLISTIKKTASI